MYIGLPEWAFLPHPPRVLREETRRRSGDVATQGLSPEPSGTSSQSFQHLVRLTFASFAVNVSPSAWLLSSRPDASSTSGGHIKGRMHWVPLGVNHPRRDVV